MHSQYWRVHLCTVLRIRPGLFTQLNFVQHRNVSGQERSNERGSKTRIWDYCPLLCSSHGCPSAGMAAAALARCLDWIWQPLVLDKYRFAVPAFAQTSSSSAHWQTELLCAPLVAVYCCSAQEFDVAFGYSADSSLSGLCMAYTPWKVLLLTVCALLLKILLLAGQVWGGTCCAPNPLFGTGQFNGI